MPQKVKMKKDQSKRPTVTDMKTGKVMAEPTRKVRNLAASGMTKTEKVVRWKDDVRNPENKEFVMEVAFNKKPNADDEVTMKDMKAVTQKEFNQRYGVKPDSTVYKKK